MLPELLATFKDDQQLLPAIVQDANSKEVLMLAWVNKEALEKTATTKPRESKKAVAGGKAGVGAGLARPRPAV